MNVAASKIHVSVECCKVLDQIGGFCVQERGQVLLKGKGKVTTYWLLGKVSE